MPSGAGSEEKPLTISEPKAPGIIWVIHVQSVQIHVKILWLCYTS